MIKKIFKGLCVIAIAIIFFETNYINANTSNNIKSDIEKTLVCIVGHDYSHLLEYEGYTIINGKVNFNVEGDYYITYMNDETKETYSKKISVINKTRVTENPYFDISKTDILSDDFSIVNTSCYLDSYYFLEQERIDEYLVNVILTKVKNGKVEYSKIIKEKMDGGVSFIDIDESGIYISGMIYSATYNYDFYISKVSFEGEVQNENIIIGNNSDNLKGTLLIGDYLFLYGETTSNKGVYSGSRQQEDSVIVKVDKKLLQEEKVNINTCAYINTFTHGCIFENKIYLVEKYVSVVETMIVKYRIQVYDFDLNLIDTYDIQNSFFLTPLNLVVSNDRIMLLGYQYNSIIEKYSSCLFEIKNKEVKLIFEYVEYSEEKVRLCDISISSDNKIILLFKDISNDGAMLLSLEDNQIEFTLKISSDGYPMKFQQNSLGYVSNNKEIIDISYILLKEDDVIINNQKRVKSNKSKINKDFSLFGNYIDEYIYEDKDICFCMDNNIYIPSSVSIKDGQIYDKNVKLEFNGIGKLNDINIKSGYIVEKEGLYTLDIIGNDNSCKTYQFEVKDYSNKKTRKKISAIVEELNIETKELTSTPNVNIVNNIEAKKAHNYYGLLLIPFVIGIIMFIVVMRAKHAK